MGCVYIQDMSKHVDQHVSVRGWLFNKRSSGKIHFLIIRDGTGFMQAVASCRMSAKRRSSSSGGDHPESSLEVEGLVRKDERYRAATNLVTRASVFQVAAEHRSA